MKTGLSLALIALAACSDDHGHSHDENEVISRVVVTFEPTNSNPRSFTWDDPDGDGGDAPTVEPITLAPGSHTMRVQFLNALETTPEDITQEVADEGEEHLVLLLGSAVIGPATTTTSGPLMQAYADTDANGLPLGLAHTIQVSPGTGTLRVVLRHMPAEEPPGKSATTLDDVKTGGLNAIGGSTDVDVEFMVTAAGAPPT